jgi:quercetin dioxygenase-like cupin family protein
MNPSKYNLIMDTIEIEKSKAHITVEIIEYFPNLAVSTTIIKKTTGSISAMSFDTGEGLSEKTSPVDMFVQVIDGRAEFEIDGITAILETGQSIILPAHKSSCIKPNGQFKLIQTVIKSAYE